MIKLIKGNYGLYDKHTVVLKTPLDKPFSIAKKGEEQRLVDKGIAVFVDVEEPQAPAQLTELAEQTQIADAQNDGNGEVDNAGDGENQGEESGEEKEVALYTDATKFDELKEIAKGLGATDEDLKPLNSKDKVKALIDELAAKKAGEADNAGDGEENGEDDGEPAPNFDGVDGVAQMSLKDEIEKDIDNVFLDLGDFADTHLVEGRDILCVLDAETLKTRQGSAEITVDESTLLLFAKESDLPKRQKVLNIDHKDYLVDDWKINAGMVEIALHQNRSQEVKCQL